MIGEYTVAALYVVPVAVAAVVAYVVTREPSDKPRVRQTGTPPVIPAPRQPRSPGLDGELLYAQPYGRRASDRVSDRTAPNPRSLVSPLSPLGSQPTLMHAALSAHLATVSRQARNVPTPAAARHAASLVSIRRPTRLVRPASHRCVRQPDPSP